MKSKSIQKTISLILTIVFATSALSSTGYAQGNDETNVTDVTDALQNELNLSGVEVEDSLRNSNSPQKVFEHVQIPSGATSQNPFTKSPSTRAPFANDPNSAYFLGPTLFNMWLSVLGDSNEDWFYFQGNANTKITAVLDQPTTGDYDIALYRLDQSTGTLHLVAFSLYSGSTRDQLSHVVVNNELYFLRIMPSIPANPSSDYTFAIIVSDTFDSAEPDGNFWQVRNYSSVSGFNVNQTIDNSIDSDWFSFNTGNRSICRVVLSNVPSGATYGFLLYDSNLNLLASFSSSGSEQIRTWQLPTNTTFYAVIRSVNGGFNATQSYRLAVQLHPSYTQTRLSPAGNYVGVFNNELYIDGRIVNLSGTLLHTSSQSIPYPPNTWVSRQQSYAASGSGVQVLGFHDVNNGVGTYTGAVLSSPSYQNISHSNAVIIEVTNIITFFSYAQYVNSMLVTPPSHSWYIYIPGNFNYTYIVIDATTGNVVDFPWLSWLYSHQGHVAKLNGVTVS